MPGSPGGTEPAGPAPELYLRLERTIAAEVDEAGGRRIDADGRTVAETVTEVENLFADKIAAGPRAVRVEERRGLLRYANRATVEQYLAFFARPWTTGGPDTTVLAFDCECAQPDCDARVELAVADFPAPSGTAPPVLASGHHAC